MDAFYCVCMASNCSCEIAEYPETLNRPEIEFYRLLLHRLVWTVQNHVCFPNAALSLISAWYAHPQRSGFWLCGTFSSRNTTFFAPFWAFYRLFRYIYQYQVYSAWLKHGPMARQCEQPWLYQCVLNPYHRIADRGLAYTTYTVIECYVAIGPVFPPILQGYNQFIQNAECGGFPPLLCSSRYARRSVLYILRNVPCDTPKICL